MKVMYLLITYVCVCYTILISRSLSGDSEYSSWIIYLYISKMDIQKPWLAGYAELPTEKTKVGYEWLIVFSALFFVLV